jgi:hypothetical protein
MEPRLQYGPSRKHTRAGFNKNARNPQILAPQKPDRFPGNVQPDSEIFPVPGEPIMQTREINNGEAIDLRKGLGLAA